MADSLTKAEIVSHISEVCDLKKVDAERALAAFLEAVAAGLSHGRKVTLVGFGSFEVVERAERLGTHPRSGERLVIPSTRVVRFRPGQPLRDAVNAHSDG
jgi:DNA-binding protein HU-beta